LQPATGQRHVVNEYRMPVRLGVPAYRDYTLDEAWEVVPGRWQFEFWHGDRQLKQQEFCLFNPSVSLSESCAAAVSGGFTAERVWTRQ
jgi:hypothetical protein